MFSFLSVPFVTANYRTPGYWGLPWHPDRKGRRAETSTRLLALPKRPLPFLSPLKFASLARGFLAGRLNSLGFSQAHLLEIFERKSPSPTARHPVKSHSGMRKTMCAQTVKGKVGTLAHTDQIETLVCCQNKS